MEPSTQNPTTTSVTQSETFLYIAVSVFICIECVLLLYLNASMDKIIIVVSLLTQGTLLFALYKQLSVVIQITHVIFILFMVICLPFLSMSSVLLGFHVMACLLTLAIRSEYRSCPISNSEGDTTTKIYHNAIHRFMNYNVLYFLCGCISLFRLCVQQLPFV